MRKILIYKYLYIIFIYNVLNIFSCSSSSQLKQSQLQYRNCSHLIAQKDSTIHLELQKSRELSARLDKTEKVLASIYLQYGQNLPRKLNESGESSNLNALILEENLDLKTKNLQLSKTIDSLSQVKKNTIYVDSPSESIKNSKKTKNQVDQQNYISQLEKNLQTEQTKNSRYQKELNAYSLRLEIIDNERLKEVREIKSKLNTAGLISDSLLRLVRLNEARISELNQNQIPKEHEKLSPKDIKLKDELKQVELDLNETRNNLKIVNKENEKLNQKISELNKTQAKNQEQIRFNEELITSLNNKLQNSLDRQDTNKDLNNKINDLTKLNHQLSNLLSSSKSENEELIKQQNIANELIKKLAQEKNIMNSKLTNKYDSSRNQLINENIRLKQLAIHNSNEIKKLETITIDQEKKLINLSEQINGLSISGNKSKKSTSRLEDSLLLKNQNIIELKNQIEKLKNFYESSILKLQDSLEASSLNMKDISTTEQDPNIENNQIKSKLISNIEPSGEPQNEISTAIQNQIVPLHDEPKVESRSSKPNEVVVESTINHSKNNKSEINTEIVIKLEKLRTEIACPGLTVRKEDGYAIIAIPQSYVFLNTTLALKEEGSKFVMKVFNILNGSKKYQIDIIAYSEPETLTEDFRLNRTRTISKLFKALGTPQLNLNTGSRVYAPNVDSDQFKEGIELIIRNL